MIIFTPETKSGTGGVVIDALTRAAGVVCVLYVVLLSTVGHVLPPGALRLISGVLVLAAVAVFLYFKKKQLPQAQLERFLRSSGVIAHRGGAADSPENTLGAFQEAKKNGAIAIEFDCELTKDGVAVLMHDATVDRTTDGTGRINQLTLSEVRQLNAAAKFSPSQSQFPYENVPTLDEAIQECLNLDLKIFFDVKAYSKQMVAEIIKLYRKYPQLYDSGMVCSFFPSTIFMVRQQDSNILTALTYEPNFIRNQLYKDKKIDVPWWNVVPIALADMLLCWSIHSWLWMLCGNSAVLLDKHIISASIVDYWAQRGIIVVAWTVNTKTEKEYFTTQLGCQIMTDYVK